MSHSHPPTLSQPLLHALLQEAGLVHPPEALTLLGHSTCAVWRFTSAGQAYVVRARLDGDVAMLRKETCLSDLLRHHTIPAPIVLASVANDDGIALLQTWLPGIPLAHALAHMDSAEQPAAWHSVGEILGRIHRIVQPVAGDIIADHVEPFPGGWSHWVLDEVIADIAWLATHAGSPQPPTIQLEKVVAAAQQCLQDAPTRLIHNDALPQNILMAAGPHGWRCTGWLDWEFARAGDPSWDLATLDFRPTGQVPPAFYAGYGQLPVEPQASIYELLMATWRTRAELEHGRSWPWPAHQARLAYLHDVPTHMNRLARVLGVDG